VYLPVLSSLGFIGPMHRTRLLKNTLPVQHCWFWSWSKPPPSDFSVVKPGKITPKVHSSDLPAHITKPQYALSGEVTEPPLELVIWSPNNIDKIRKSCQLASRVLKETGKHLQPGITTEEIDYFVHNLIIKNGAYPSPLNFHGYPKSVSTSVNNVAVHGIPDDRVLEDGDIINIDITVFLDGFHGDCSKTFLVGHVDAHGRKLVNVTDQCLDLGISYCGPNKQFRDIGRVIHKFARQHNCTPIPILIGHGIGNFFHGPPDIYHCLNNYPGRMQPGMIFTIEPCLSEGDRRVKILDDGWTAITLDNSRAAQAEHTVLITRNGVEVLTK